MSFPSSPSSASSCVDSQSTNHDHLSPPTPDSYFFPTPAIVCHDEFQMEIQLDELAVSPQPPVPPKTVPCFLSGDDMSKLQVFLRNKGRWGNMYNQFESSPPLRPVQPDSTWEVTQSPLMDPNQLPDPSRCSLLIHEVSLLVGLTDDDYLSPDDAFPLPDASKQVHDILPLTLTPTKSLASRKPILPHLTNTDTPLLSSPSGTNPYAAAEDANPSLYNHAPSPVGSRDLATPIPRYKNADAERPSLSPRRRHGQVFHFEPPPANVPHRNALDLDQTFCSPRAPPPKPTPNPSANRCSSLDRLEHSLLKLEAHAPLNHRKSRSEGRTSDRVLQRENKRPSLPPRHLKKQQSSHEIVPRHLSRSTHGRHVSGPAPPVPRPILPHQHVVPPIRPAAPLDDDLFEEDATPGSFMDMDIPHTEEAGKKRRASFCQVKSKERMKSLVSAAKRVSRGVIAWGGKFLTGSTKPAQETSTIRSGCV